MRMTYKSTLCLAALFGLSSLVGEAESGWIIEIPAKRMMHDTRTGLTKTDFGETRSHEFTARRGGVEASSFWLPGAFRPSISIQGSLIVDGTDPVDVSRVGGFRFADDGSTLFVRTTKGRDAVVELIHNGKTLRTWPRGNAVQIISFDKGEAHFAIFNGDKRHLEIFRINTETGSALFGTAERIARMPGCGLVTGRKRGVMLVLELICKPGHGSDVHVLDLKTGEIRALVSGPGDDMLLPLKTRDRKRIPVLSVAGNANAKFAFHAIKASLLSQLGEPRSVGSDAMGTQSWGVSYRIRALAELAAKTKHNVFADLAVNAMTNVLGQTNKAHGVSGPFNPSCGWASRIYSRDGVEPVSLLVNQAMISGSLLVSCDRLGALCPAELETRIQAVAQCLARHFEPHFDAETGLYRIQYGASFRFDGVWAPWNWQLSWAGVLARIKDAPVLIERSKTLAAKFVKSWQTSDKQALWRYWPDRFFDGWNKGENVSKFLPSKPQRTASRFEDVNHAGISLLAFSDAGNILDHKTRIAGRATLDRLVQQGFAVHRHIDGAGPATPSWIPAAGWHALATDSFRALYSHSVPNASSGPRHLAYALLYDPQEEFRMTLELKQCNAQECVSVSKRTFSSVAKFLRGNDLFMIEHAPDFSQR